MSIAVKISSETRTNMCYNRHTKNMCLISKAYKTSKLSTVLKSQNPFSLKRNFSAFKTLSWTVPLRHFPAVPGFSRGSSILDNVQAVWLRRPMKSPPATALSQSEPRVSVHVWNCLVCFSPHLNTNKEQRRILKQSTHKLNRKLYKSVTVSR